MAIALAPSEIASSGGNLGYAGGNNVAIARALEAGAEYVLLLNSDAEVEENADRRASAASARYPEIAVIGPVIVESMEFTAYHAGGRDIAKHVRHARYR